MIVDVPTRALESHFDYTVPDALGDIEVGSCVLVDFAGRSAVGYVVGLADSSRHERLKDVEALLGGPFFGVEAAQTARWIAEEYACPLSEALRLFVPPGGTPKAVRSTAEGEPRWVLKHPGVGPVDDRWAELMPAGEDYRPRANATLQRAVLDALAVGPVRVAELSADLGAVGGALTALEGAGAVRVFKKRRMRDDGVRERPAPRHAELTAGQAQAVGAIESSLCGEGGVIVLDGVTGSGKTEVYLRAIETALDAGGTACVLVPEISLTPQTVGRFRSRFGDEVAVLHSRLAAGERYDQWDLVREGRARIVIGARSALFAPLRDLRLIVIDEEHEASYKQSSAPRYHAREVAANLAERFGATLVLGSASLSMEARLRADRREWTLVRLPDRATGQPLPPVEVVDMAAEFAQGHRSMFSRPLHAALKSVQDRGEKAVLFLNRRGFASFLLCRECGYVPRCEQCSTSLTFHEVGSRLMCHHCGATRSVPPVCPSCGSAYLRQFGAGTQRVEAELQSVLPGWPVVRMDADTTRGKGAHERLLASFESLPTGVLLGTQMIAKGLDFPEVTLVGVIAADVTLHLPDFRAGERTYQLLEQVSGRAGRGERGGCVIVQTYWPQNSAIRAAALHDPAAFYSEEDAVRRELGYPPFGRLANLLVWGREQSHVSRFSADLASALLKTVPADWRVLGPSPSPLSRLKGVWRWHVLLKAPLGAPLSTPISEVLKALPTPQGVSVAADIDPVDLL